MRDFSEDFRDLKISTRQQIQQGPIAHDKHGDIFCFLQVSFPRNLVGTVLC